MRISTGVLTHDGKCWKNEPVEVPDIDLNEIGEGWFKHICDASSPSDCLSLSEYLKAVISLAGKK